MEYPRITHVAIRFRDRIWTLPAPNRHHDVIRHIIDSTGVDAVDVPVEDEGFADATGRFLNRKQALFVAEMNDQLRADRPIWHGQLFSENLW